VCRSARRRRPGGYALERPGLSRRRRLRPSVDGRGRDQRESLRISARSVSTIKPVKRWSGAGDVLLRSSGDRVALRTYTCPPPLRPVFRRSYCLFVILLQYPSSCCRFFVRSRGRAANGGGLESRRCSTAGVGQCFAARYAGVRLVFSCAARFQWRVRCCRLGAECSRWCLAQRCEGALGRLVPVKSAHGEFSKSQYSNTTTT
jgi:hypothetical protein